MRFATVHNEEDLDSMVSRVFGRLKRNEKSAALRGLLQANPQLVDVAGLLPGTVVTIPQLDGIAPAPGGENIETAYQRATVEGLSDHLDELAARHRVRREGLQAQRRTVRTNAAKAAFAKIPQGEEGREHLEARLDERVAAEEEEAKAIVDMIRARIEHLG